LMSYSDRYVCLNIKDVVMIEGNRFGCPVHILYLLCCEKEVSGDLSFQTLMSVRLGCSLTSSAYSRRIRQNLPERKDNSEKFVSIDEKKADTPNSKFWHTGNEREQQTFSMLFSVIGNLSRIHPDDLPTREKKNRLVFRAMESQDDYMHIEEPKVDLALWVYQASEKEDYRSVQILPSTPLPGPSYGPPPNIEKLRAYVQKRVRHPETECKSTVSARITLNVPGSSRAEKADYLNISSCPDSELAHQYKEVKSRWDSR